MSEEEQTNQAHSIESDEVTDLRRQLAESKETITALERRQQIDQALAHEKTVDLEAARLLTEMAVTQMDDQDVSSAVEELKRKRPYLFEPDQAQPASMPAQMGAGEPGSLNSTTYAAAHARDTGNRQDLLRYLRLRRQG